MKYSILNETIPKNQRAEINKQCLSLVRTNNLQGLTPNDIANAYTGIGGLHELNFKDFTSYNAYSTAKKEIENGQFLTPMQVCNDIVKLLPIKNTDICADLTCGIGHFFNPLPNESNVYGCELDNDAYTIAKFLYPNANIENADIRNYTPNTKFDYIVGNPPFNLSWQIGRETQISQNYFTFKASSLLKPAGILAFIAPETWLNDSMYYSNLLIQINNEFSFIGQYLLPTNTFAQYGTDNFATKVLFFAKKTKHIAANEYIPTYNTYSEISEKIGVYMRLKEKAKHFIHKEFLAQNDIKQHEIDRVKKYLYEIKIHAVLQPFYKEALKAYNDMLNPIMPAWIANIKDYEERYKEWEKLRVTMPKLLRMLKRIIKKQSAKHVDKIEWVKIKSGYKLKAYSPKMQASLNKEKCIKLYITNDCIANGITPLIPKHLLKSFNRKLNDLNKTSIPIKQIERDASIDKYVSEFSFLNASNTQCFFAEKQKHDIGLIIQRDRCLLAWQQGIGKTAATYCYAKYHNQRVNFVLSISISVHITWRNFFEQQNESYAIIEKRKDLPLIMTKKNIVISLQMLIKYKKEIRKYIKLLNKKVTLIFDESDTITNRNTKSAKAVFDCFKDVSRKVLATGTTTRNRISEYYPQLELLYNNSYNLLCTCETIYVESKDKKIQPKVNDYYNMPFDAKHGMSLFIKCFNPTKATVFGVQRGDQSIYNEKHLRNLIEKTVISRKFKDVVGDKYTIENVLFSQSAEEKEIYLDLITNIHKYIPKELNKKDRMFRALKQLNLLLKATSMPQAIKGNFVPTKAYEIFDKVHEFSDKKVAIGVGSHESIHYYEIWLKERFADRELFIITGNDKATKGKKQICSDREKIIKDFEATENGILLCIQASLSASVNIGSCDIVLIEYKPYNIPKLEQFIFRFIRYDSLNKKKVFIFSYTDTIEMNLLALLLDKEKANEYGKTLEYKTTNEIFEDFNVETSILEMLLSKEIDRAGKVSISWGGGQVVE